MSRFSPAACELDGARNGALQLQTPIGARPRHTLSIMHDASTQIGLADGRTVEASGHRVTRFDSGWHCQDEGGKTKGLPMALLRRGLQFCQKSTESESSSKLLSSATASRQGKNLIKSKYLGRLW